MGFEKISALFFVFVFVFVIVCFCFCFMFQTKHNVGIYCTNITRYSASVRAHVFLVSCSSIAVL